MDGIPDEDLAVPRGPARTIAFARDDAGRRPALEFLRFEAPARDRAQLDHLFHLLAETGWIANRERFRKERGEIWAFKASSARVAAFQRGRVWFLTHGFLKKRDKWPPGEIEQAERIRAEHLTREAGRREEG